VRVLCAPDKLRGTLGAKAAARALADGLVAVGAQVACLPLSDGGEGFLDALGGANRASDVHNAYGAPVVAPWHLAAGRAVIESALVIGYVPGLELDPARAESATTFGVGELVAEALLDGAGHVSIGLGGSVTTDGGAGALEALDGFVPFRPDCEIVVATDVSAGFFDAARVFAPQKGADAVTVAWLERRLAVQAEVLRERFAADVSTVAGAGAAGGLAGGLWAAGARLTPGFEFVAGHVDLPSRVAAVDLVVTAEGRLDRTSFAGKVVGGVLAEAARAGVRAVVVAGQADPEAVRLSPVPVIDLSERFGEERSMGATADCLRETAELILAAGA
jgi:glycerate kinase